MWNDWIRWKYHYIISYVYIRKKKAFSYLNAIIMLSLNSQVCNAKNAILYLLLKCALLRWTWVLMNCIWIGLCNVYKLCVIAWFLQGVFGKKILSVKIIQKEKILELILLKVNLKK